MDGAQQQTEWWSERHMRSRHAHLNSMTRVLSTPPPPKPSLALSCSQAPLVLSIRNMQDHCSNVVSACACVCVVSQFELQDSRFHCRVHCHHPYHTCPLMIKLAATWFFYITFAEITVFCMCSFLQCNHSLMTRISVCVSLSFLPCKSYQKCHYCNANGCAASVKDKTYATHISSWPWREEHVAYIMDERSVQ